jgi:hypothetical protein
MASRQRRKASGPMACSKDNGGAPLGGLDIEYGRRSYSESKVINRRRKPSGVSIVEIFNE